MLLNRGKAVIEGDIKSEFGADGLTGANKISEIRTLPSECPFELVNRIHGVFKRKAKSHPKVLDYKWQAGSFCLHSLAGHIHFGVPKKIIPHETANKVIANYLGSLSLAIEDKEGAYNRRNADGDNAYGFLNDYREQPYGGFESRCLSSHLVSPLVCLAHFCLAKTVMFELLNNKSWSPTERFTDDHFIEADQNSVKKHFEDIWGEIANMTLYPQYKQYIDLFKWLIERNLTWFPRDENGDLVDVKTAWGICGNIIPTEKPQLTLSDIWAKEPIKGIF